MSVSGLTVLYVSGEESETQIKMRADRLGCKFGNFYLVFETDIDKVVSEFIPSVKPDILIIDSINTMTSADVGAAASSPSQVNYATSQLQHLAKSSGLSVFMVGQVTLEGGVAGGRKVTHDVDTVLYLEGDTHNFFRLLRAQKNRFGSVGEIGVFEMVANGLVEVGNPSAAFLAERANDKPGSSVAILMEGSRPIIVEVQALCSTSNGNPARRSTGVNRDRMYIISAVLDKYIPVIDLFDTDLFMSVVGGMKVIEPAADLSMALAIVSSFQDTPTPNDVAAIGEIGLTGELRSVTQLEMRLREAANLGFRRVIVPKIRRHIDVPDSLQLIECSTLEEAIIVAFDGKITFETNDREPSHKQEERRARRKASVMIDTSTADENGHYDTDVFYDE
jgi:DNA repair protein RadA/Sms